MKSILHPKETKPIRWLLPTIALTCTLITVSAQESEEDQEVFELSPFEVDASQDMGYYASQSLAGGRLSTDIINTGSSIEVVTADFMDDIGANDIQELLQYTTNTEIGGNLGNFVGVGVDTAQGDVNDQASARNPDQTARVRGLARPDTTRDFFKTDIPFDQYNTERVDINRGSNSFLFGLGSPAGLINSQLARAQFNDRTKLRFRIGSGGERPSYRAELDVNREVIKDRLAVRVATMMNRTQYRQEPAYRDDNRIFGTVTWHPFDNKKNTTIRAHWESGDILSTPVITVLPQQALDTWIKNRTPINVDLNTRLWRHQFGPSEGDYTNSQDRMWGYNDYWPLGGFYARYENMDEWVADPDNVDPGEWLRSFVPMTNISGAGYALVFDGTTPGVSYVLQGQTGSISDLAIRWGGEKEGVNSPQWRNERLDDGTRRRVYVPREGGGDSWWSPTGRTNGNPSMRFYANARDELANPVGWFKQGFTDLDTFDFSKQTLSGHNDYWERDFYNYNVTLEQLFLDGKAGLEVAYDFQNTTREARTFFTNGAEIRLDINMTIPLPQTDASGNIIYPQYESDSLRPVVDENGYVVGGAMPNPNFGRPFVNSRRDQSRDRNDRTTLRATAFYKLDFEDMAGDDGWLKWLGSHTFSILGDKYLEEHEAFQSTLRSFSDDFRVGDHVADNSATSAVTAARQVGAIAYLGPPVQSYLGDSVWDPGTPLSLQQIVLQAANYNMQVEDGNSFPMTYWNKGSWPEGAVIGTDAQIDGDEYWATANLQPRWVPNEGVWIQRTEVESWAVNAQSFFLNRYLVINTGYREDFIDSWLNRLAPKIGEDGSPVITPDVFKPEDGDFEETIKGPSGSGTFGYGAVVHWPRNIIKIPESMDISFHYNFSENFIPDNSRRSINADREFVRLPSPQGESLDYGVTFQLFDRRLIVRLNWYENILVGADGSVGNIFNQNINKIFAAYNNMNTQKVYLDSSDGTVTGAFDGVINTNRLDPDRGSDLVFEEDGATPVWETDEFGDIVYNEDGDPVQLTTPETDASVIERLYPNWGNMLAAHQDLEALLFSGYYQIKADRQRVRSFPDGSLDDESINGLTDLEDIKSTGFEASITWNPTRNWRMRINVAQQETVRTNITPNLTRFIEQDWLPWVIEHGYLRWGGNPSQSIGSGTIISENVNENLLEYFTVKAQEGFPSDEVREWRVNMVTNYTFRDGPLDGFSIGGSARWQSAAAIGYPLILQEVLPGNEILIGDVTNPYMSEEEFSFDLSIGYSKRIKKVNWQIQLNLRNLQNIDSDETSVLIAQPDGSPARVRWDPPFQWQVTNTFRW